MILIIDDKDLDWMIEDLEDEGFGVVQPRAVSNTKDALSLIQEINPSIVLLDLQLSSAGEEGKEIAFFVRNNYPEMRIISISDTTKRAQRNIYDDLVTHIARKKSKNVLSCLRGNCNCEKERQDFRKGKAREEFFNLLCPLHLSLQAFWGVSYPKDTREVLEEIEIVKFGTNKEAIKEIAELEDGHIKRHELSDHSDGIDSGLTILMPNTDAFLLVEEATYDFYAPLIDILSIKEATGLQDIILQEEREMYQERFCQLLNVFKQGSPIWEEFYNVLAGKETYKTNFFLILGKHKIEVNFVKFVGALKELAFILACTLDYKGVKKARDKHSKKNKKKYEILKRQIIEFGLEKSCIIIAGIEFLKEVME